MTDFLLEKGFVAPNLKETFDKMSFKVNTLDILGSFGLRSQLYTSDIDLFQVVQLPIAEIKKQFVDIIRSILKDKTLFLGDVKLGIYEKFRVINENHFISEGKVYHYDYEKSMEKLGKLKGYMNSNEFREFRLLLKRKPSVKDLGQMSKNLRFHILRWKPREILKGFKILRDGYKFTLEEGFRSNALFKLDCIKFMGNYFKDISIIYDLRTTKGLKLNNFKGYDVRKALKSDIGNYMNEGQYFKVLKRYFSLLRYEFQHRGVRKHMPKLVVLGKILNSQLGLLYQVKSILDTLVFVIENFREVEFEKVKATIMLVIDRLSYVYKKRFVNHENEVVGNLLMVLKGRSIGKVEDFLASAYERIEGVLNKEAKSVVSSLLT